MCRPALLLTLALLPVTPAFADVSLPKVISDRMVLQRDRAVPLWGTAAPGEVVTVTFHDKTASATADATGHWQLAIDTGPASARPADLTVAGQNTLHLHDILVGEVWICGGQSNMEYPLNRTFLNDSPPPPASVADVARQEYPTANIPELRILRVERNLNRPDLPTDGWHPATGQPLEHFSAPGYFFGKALHHELGVPIGLIQSAWAGSRIEPWTPPDAYAASPALKGDAARTPGRLDGSPVGNYYTKLVQPLAPFAARGVIWYQGESNVITTNDGMRYFDKFEALVNGWRKAWQNPDLAFIQVQLAPFAYSKRKDAAAHPVTALPELWEAQQAALKLPHIGMVVIHDITDDLSNIHPWNKWDVGRRLALWALGTEYGRQDLEYSGPLFDRATFAGGKAVVSFTHAASGLKSRDGKPLSDFQLAGEDGKFVPAAAEVQGQTVVVSSPAVPAPKAVRFAWTEGAKPNLINGARLPAGAFRSDGPLGR